jgi:hypothetical protein
LILLLLLPASLLILLLAPLLILLLLRLPLPFLALPALLILLPLPVLLLPAVLILLSLPVLLLPAVLIFPLLLLPLVRRGRSAVPGRRGAAWLFRNRNDAGVEPARQHRKTKNHPDRSPHGSA